MKTKDLTEEQKQLLEEIGIAGVVVEYHLTVKEDNDCVSAPE